MVHIYFIYVSIFAIWNIISIFAMKLLSLFVAFPNDKVSILQNKIQFP